MELEEAIRQRRSIRRFQPEKIPLPLIKEMLDLCRHAPSACNIQGWRFIIVTDEKLKNEIFDHGGSMVIRDAPQTVLFFYDKRTDNTEYNDYIQSASAAIQNFLLIAHSTGIGTCWVNHLPRKKVLQRIFHLPKRYEPIAAVILGYPSQERIVEMKRKFLVEEIISVNQEFPNLKLSAEGNTKHQIIKRFFRRLYYLAPKSVKRLLNKFLDEHFVKKFEN
ncbi:MAG TPA: nitroreductase family protein [Candidatus Nanoarchaeia archaeon]|nr:nitroreductase family protein [Candidatus Nanoarchaeia archaeon]